MSYITSITFKYTETNLRDGSISYIDEQGYESVNVNHSQKTIIHYKKGCPSINGSAFYNYIVKLLDIVGYSDITVQTYMANASEKKLKAQGFKKNP